jgi:hypothetical protein
MYLVQHLTALKEAEVLETVKPHLIFHENVIFVLIYTFHCLKDMIPLILFHAFKTYFTCMKYTEMEQVESGFIYLTHYLELISLPVFIDVCNIKEMMTDAE